MRVSAKGPHLIENANKLGAKLPGSFAPLAARIGQLSIGVLSKDATYTGC